MPEALVSEVNTLTETLRLHLSDRLIRAVGWPIKAGTLALVAELTEWGVRLHLDGNVRAAIDSRMEELKESQYIDAFRDRWREATLYGSEKSHDVQFGENVAAHFGIPRRGTKEQRALYLEAEANGTSIHAMSLERRRQRLAKTGDETAL